MLAFTYSILTHTNVIIQAYYFVICVCVYIYINTWTISPVISLSVCMAMEICPFLNWSEFHLSLIDYENLANCNMNISSVIYLEIA